MISKPIVPPWDDSAKNIVRGQVVHGRRYRYRVLAERGSDAPAPGVMVDPIYQGAGSYSPGVARNIKVMMHGLRPRGAAIYHYFFAPNPVTSMAGRVQRLFARVKCIQTVCSTPASFDNIGRKLFTDLVVVLSRHTHNRMLEAGVSRSRLRMVRPGIEPIEKPGLGRRAAIRREHGLPQDSPVVVFPGDYEFSSAAETVGRAVPMLVREFKDVRVVFACRTKSQKSESIKEFVRLQVQRAGFADNVLFLGRVADMPSFVGAADVVVMPAESLYAKMDFPLVLLEAMSQEVPLVLADVPPLSELLAYGVGSGVPPADPEALAEATARLLEDDALRANRGRAGAQAVREYFSATAMSEAIENIYDEVMAS